MRKQRHNARNRHYSFIPHMHSCFMSRAIPIFKISEFFGNGCYIRDSFNGFIHWIPKGYKEIKLRTMICKQVPRQRLFLIHLFSF
uniref:Uncharacterized protein n=1 Tax=Rhizophora mucronata TaxID=61149 RepID=A0A2P2Q4T1_RHIMU